ncbi:MAG: carbohydrate binding domain-containing protein [Anaerolineae bacterium]|nr:carbohydrate binding domain-containing protein [Anaerolineae bacterium]MDW8070158.1 LamG-like jellyroll fold domain-containing protein [Anaerolineae bacterium]
MHDRVLGILLRIVVRVSPLAGAALGMLLVLLVSFSQPVAVRSGSPPRCSDVIASLTPDYAYVVGSATFYDPDGDPESGSRYRWLVNNTPITDTLVAESILLNFDQSTSGAGGEMPTVARGVTYVVGKWGHALALAAGGQLKYPRLYNLPLEEGTIEMWVALRADGDDARYTARTHYLFFYRANDGDYITIAQSKDTRILYAGGSVDGQWQSAYGIRAYMGNWKAGEWHHLAFTYSARENFMRFYVDGILTADTNERRYRPPDADGAEFALGHALWGGEVADYWVDSVRISARVASAQEIAARAERETAPRANEVWLPTALLPAGAQVVYEFTPVAAGEAGTPCVSAPVLYPSTPVFDPQPPSTLLPPGATSFTLTVHSLSPTRCAYSVQRVLPYAQMTPFGETTDTRTHTTEVRGLNPDPNTINDVYVRCASHPDFRLRLRYRSLSPANPSFPRTGNLWGWWEWRHHNRRSLEDIAKVDLWLGADATPDEIRQLRRLNPHIRILTSINAVENNDIPSPDYYLKDVNGNRIEVWPGSYRLNLTKREVAEYQAQYAYRAWLDTGMMADGVFFDNVMLTQSWLKYDIYGNRVRIDANEDGVEDDPAWLDAAWKAGVFHEIRTFRRLMPYAIVSGHSMDIYEPGVGELFDGISLGFVTADVLEGERSFSQVWDLYQTWMREARQPPVVMFEASPMDQIAYGYGYRPWSDTPPSTLEFARTFYPYMRFGLALTLLHDGYFAYEFGDTWHGNDWWYDELDFALGYPLGPAYRVDVGFDPGPNQVVNPSFEDSIAYPWRFWVNTGAGCQASVQRDITTAATGSASARIDVTATSGVEWHVDLHQDARTLVRGKVYDLVFQARADRERPLTVAASKNQPNWDNYGLYRRLMLRPSWQTYTVTFEARATASDARLQFFAGATTGTVWLDNVRLHLHPPDVYRRDYTRGTVLLNGTTQPQTVTLGAGYRRLLGTQAPLYESILDDADPGFRIVSGTWVEKTYDSGEWTARGPFYHAWKTRLHELSSDSGEVRWTLPIQAQDVYTITAWWPAAPVAPGWNAQTRFEVVQDDQVLATAILDQRQRGDEWHLVAAVELRPSPTPYVRLVCSGAPCVADALHLRSTARYNNGQAASTITLAPLDGIILQRGQGVYLPLIRKSN